MVAGFSVEAGICLATGLALSSAVMALALVSAGAAFSLAISGAGRGSGRDGAAFATALDLYNRSMNPELSNSLMKVRSTNCSGFADRAFGSLTPSSRKMISIPLSVGYGFSGIKA